MGLQSTFWVNRTTLPGARLRDKHNTPLWWGSEAELTPSTASPAAVILVH